MTDEIREVSELRPFVVRHYTDDERPSIKGNGFDGLEVGENRQEAEEFIAWINARLCLRRPASAPADGEREAFAQWLDRRGAMADLGVRDSYFRAAALLREASPQPPQANTTHPTPTEPPTND